MDKLKECKNYATSLSLISTRDNMEQLLKSAEQQEKSYLEFLHDILNNEIKHRQEKARKKRHERKDSKKQAFPLSRH
jgi:DNA topoisomerase IA